MNLISFQVLPALPERLAPLRDLAYNLYWTWDHDTTSLFRRLDPELWERSGHNPVMMLGTISQARLERLASSNSFVTHVGRCVDRLERYMTAKTWYERTYGDRSVPRIAYFSAEFGLTECLRLYSGGLGILAGDHLKSASDLGLPLVGVGILYQEGYFRQTLDVEGNQRELMPKNDFYNAPVRPVEDADGRPVSVEVAFPGRTVHVQVWYAQVGRVRLYLLDTNVPENAPLDREITNQLYGGDKERRLQQEIVLGIGGLRALEAVGVDPLVCHLNEGHAAFLTLERLRQISARHGVPVDAAIAAVKAGCVFTTHTPVPAGIDLFSAALVEPYIADIASQLRVPASELLALGRVEPEPTGDEFNMAVLALRLSAYTNGVSRLHGAVSRALWQHVWPEVPVDEIPIGHITNGIHVGSWIAEEVAKLFERHQGTEWYESLSDPNLLEQIQRLPDDEVWRTHERCRERLVAFTRRRLYEQLCRRGAPPAEILTAREVLSPHTLTIGFARRFATYKRHTLLLRDPERLKRILLDPSRPVQIVFAGKAHPHDEGGKQLIREIVEFARQPELRRNIVFLEDYDIALAKQLISGVDVWLNTPRRPNEACGTSGMKALFNGVLNCSIPDGWWAEAHEMAENAGWTVGTPEVYATPDYQDHIEAHALYELLEREIAPLFYSRRGDDVPLGWVRAMKRSMCHLGLFFNTDRMVIEYLRRVYKPAAERFTAFTSDGFGRALAYSQKRREAEAAFANVAVVDAGLEEHGRVLAGDEVEIRAAVDLGSLAPEDVDVQAYVGRIGLDGSLQDARATSLPHREATNGLHRFAGKISVASAGHCAFAVRVLPRYVDLASPFEWHLVRWG
jgi:starch phosphorylase